MVKDFLISFSDNFKEKTKNPFLGTYLLVWLIRNWDLIYSLFNFDPKSNRGERIKFVKAYYSETNFVENLLINILWSFGLLILTYVLVNISRVIVNLSEKQLTPLIYKVTDSKSIVLKEEYDRVRSENDELQSRLDKERESRSKLETRIKNFEEEILEISKVKIKSEIDNTTETAKSDANFQTSKTGDAKDRTDLFIARIKERSTIENFLNLCMSIQEDKAIANDYKSLDFFLKLGLFIFKANQSAYGKYYSITEDGKKVLDKIRLEI